MTSPASARSLLGIAPSAATPTNSTLIIIDPQNEYISGKLRVTNAASSRVAIESLLQSYREANAPVVHVLHDVPEGAPIFTPGTDLADELDELKPTDREDVVRKQFPGSFTGTDLEEVLKKAGREKIVLTGYMAHVCVSTTARQGHERGWDVTVVEDAIGDRDIPGVKGDEVTRVVLAELGDFFATVVSSKDIA